MISLDDLNPLEEGQIMYQSLNPSKRTELEELCVADGLHLKFRYLIYSRITSIYDPFRYSIGILSSIVDVIGPQKNNFGSPKKWGSEKLPHKMLPKQIS